VWALVSAAAGLALRRFGPAQPAATASPWASAIGIALAVTAIAYLAVFAVDRLFGTDLRFWIVAVKWPDARQWGIALIYLVPITAAFLAQQRGVLALTVGSDSSARSYRSAMLAMGAGIGGLMALIYGIFFASGTLITGFDPLTTVIALQFVAVLPVIAIVAVFAWRRTGSHRAGALLTGLLVTLYVVAGTATQG
ncbi:alpha/beta hydrolase, partial [Sphingomonas sp. HMWF008]